MFNDIRLQNFRCYDDDAFEFDSGVNIIVGPNTSGKTSLLEALQLVGSGASYRGTDADMIRHGAAWGRVEAHAPKIERVIKLVQNASGEVSRAFTIDQQTTTRLDNTNKIPVILFEPNHLQLLSGSPELRRNFVDDLLEQTDPTFASLRKNYQRALRQRNALLKQPHSHGDMLFVWNIRLSDLGGVIATKRLGLIQRFNATLGTIYNDIAKSTIAVTLSYVTKCTENGEAYGSTMLKLLEAQVELDQRRGYTGVGIHRDDLAVLFNGLPAPQTASRGEVRTVILALKILETALVEEAYHQKPVLLLDDVFSELDGARRQSLTHTIKGHQTFITTTDADIVVQHFMKNCRIIPLG